MVKIDYDKQELYLKDRPDVVKYDILSVNAGSTPSVDLESIGKPELDDYAIAPVKPISNFSDKWEKILRVQEEAL